MNQLPLTFLGDVRDNDVRRFHELLQETYWAKNRTIEEVRRSMENSIVIVARDPDDGLVGCARAITDKVTHTWICDVVVAATHQGQGIGNRMLLQLLAHPDIRQTKKVLVTKDAQSFYQRIGFEKHQFECMSMNPDQPGNFVEPTASEARLRPREM